MFRFKVIFLAQILVLPFHCFSMQNEQRKVELEDASNTSFKYWTTLMYLPEYYERLDSLLAGKISHQKIHFSDKSIDTDATALVYIQEKMQAAQVFESDAETMEYAISLALEKDKQVGCTGIFAEFGVGLGRSGNFIAKKIGTKILYGFDWYKGLPEDWRSPHFLQGTFGLKPGVKIPPLPLADNIELVIGRFKDVLPNFLSNKNTHFAFVHIDCDIYSSTKEIFDNIRNYIADGTIIVFDEYFNYDGWQEHEFKAFQEFIKDTGYSYEYISYNKLHQQVSVRIIVPSKPSNGILAMEQHTVQCAMPEDLKLYNSRGLQYELQGDIDGAFKTYEEAMHINPNFIETRFHDGKDADRFDVLNLGLPASCLKWNGEDLNGKTIVVYSEKGLGDTIQFCRFVPLLKSKLNAAHIFFKPQTPLVGLLKNSDFNAEILHSGDSLSALTVDYYVSVLSLPHLLNMNIKDIPAKAGYLHADKQRIESFKQKFFNNDNLKIGIVWQGDPNHVNDKNRSMKLSELYPLTKISGVRVYSLQKNYGSEQLKNMPGDVQIVDLGNEIKDFDDTAAIIENLDVFIGVDTALIHLSGALNKKTILLLSDSVDWRWFCYCSKDYNPWYDSLIKVRQACPGIWTDVIDQADSIIKNLKKVH